MNTSIELTTEPMPELREIILGGVRDFNSARFTRSAPPETIAVALRDETGTPVGGLWGRIAGNWLSVELIFVPEKLRGAGLATALLRTAEEEASRRGCHGAWLETLNTDALELYRALGYRTFAELEDYAEGASRHFLRKDLRRS